MKSFILLENIEIYAYHGVFPQETTVGNVFIINLKLTVDFGKAAQNDTLDDTVSYADVYAVVKEEMQIPSKLIEHAAKRIVDHLKKEFPQIKEVEIKLSKRNPPMGGQLDYASVIIID